MEWSPEQEAALRAVDRWFREGGSQVFRLFGYAGTGKTTLARHFAEGHSGVQFGAYTGKAALVLQKKGCDGATTIHSLIYSPKDKSRARLKELEQILVQLGAAGKSSTREAREILYEIEVERAKLRQPAFTLQPFSIHEDTSLFVIDECSMVDGRVGEDLLSFGRPVLVLGDPAQLPPVKGAGFFTEQRPDFMLTEIHRQARDNPIIHLATTVREGGSLALGAYGESSVLRREEVRQEDVLEASQVLVGKNATRTSYNRRIRQLIGRDHPVPIPGDKLVCLHNNHDLGLLNGAIWYAGSIASWDDKHLVMDVQDEDAARRLEGIECHMAPFMGEEKKMMWYERKEREEFTYGYALTVHKSQGSQWPSVYLFDESRVFRADSRKWLYTGITRASEMVTIAR